VSVEKFSGGAKRLNKAMADLGAHWTCAQGPTSKDSCIKINTLFAEKTIYGKNAYFSENFRFFFM